MHQYGNPVTFHRLRLLCSASTRLRFSFDPARFKKTLSSASRGIPAHDSLAHFWHSGLFISYPHKPRWLLRWIRSFSNSFVIWSGLGSRTRSFTTPRFAIQRGVIPCGREIPNERSAR